MITYNLVTRKLETTQVLRTYYEVHDLSPGFIQQHNTQLQVST